MRQESYDSGMSPRSAPTELSSRDSSLNTAAVSSMGVALAGGLALGLAFARSQFARSAAVAVPICGLFGILLSLVALRELRQSGTGRLLAILGMVVSIGLLIVTVVFVVLVALALGSLSYTGY